MRTTFKLVSGCLLGTALIQVGIFVATAGPRVAMAQPGPPPSRALTADTDASRLVSGVTPGFLPASNTLALQDGPFVLTDWTLNRYAQYQFVFYAVPTSAGCGTSPTAGVFLGQTSASTSIFEQHGLRLLVGAGQTFCVYSALTDGSVVIAWSGFRPY
jgi:hypothetical protein